MTIKKVFPSFVPFKSGMEIPPRFPEFPPPWGVGKGFWSLRTRGKIKEGPETLVSVSEPSARGLFREPNSRRVGPVCYSLP